MMEPMMRVLILLTLANVVTTAIALGLVFGASACK